MSPIIIFKNHEQAYQSLFEWQDRLSLSDWVIDINLQYNEPVVAPNWGSSTSFRAMHIANINIPMPKPCQINYFPLRYCQELILVHELMHIRLPGYDIDPNTTEGKFFESENHAILESIAKALIMSKYNLTIDWFYNF